VNILKEKKKLFSVSIHDCEIKSFCSGGPGGQHQNKVATGIRIIHRLSGAVGEARDSKSQSQNKLNAFKRMANTKEFTNWARLQAAKLISGKSIDSIVDEQLQEQFIKTEIKDDKGCWKFVERIEENA